MLSIGLTGFERETPTYLAIMSMTTAQRSAKVPTDAVSSGRSLYRSRGFFVGGVWGELWGPG